MKLGVIVVRCQREFAQPVAADGTIGRRANMNDAGQTKCDQNSHDRNDDQELEQREPPSLFDHGGVESRTWTRSWAVRMSSPARVLMVT